MHFLKEECYERCENVKKYIFGVGFVETGAGQSLKAINHNYFNLKNMKEKPK